MSETITLGEDTYPAKYQVCPTCEGRGTSSAYLGAFTQDDMQDMGPEFMDDYRRGDYDKECPECHGRTTVLQPDSNRMEAAQRQAVDNYYDAMATYDAEVAAERRQGA